LQEKILARRQQQQLQQPQTERKEKWAKNDSVVGFGAVMDDVWGKWQRPFCFSCVALDWQCVVMTNNWPTLSAALIQGKLASKNNP
jgi:hypothetical protein